MQPSLRVLLVEDNPFDAHRVREALLASRDPAFRVHWLGRLEAALAQLAGGEVYDLVLLDVGLAEAWGTDALSRVVAAAPHVPVVVLASQADPALEGAVLRLGAEDCLLKGRIEPGELRRALVYAVERRRAGTVAREGAELYRMICEHASDGILTIDDRGTLRQANPAAERIFGYPPGGLLGRPITDLTPPALRARHQAGLRQYLETGERRLDWERTEMTGFDAQGRSFPLEISFTELHQEGERLFTAILRSIGGRREDEALRAAQERLRRAQKMEGVGRLAGGVAHDFNNLLTTITGFAELAMAQLPTDSPARADLQEIRRAVDRAAELVRQLLAFSRQQVLRPEVLELNDLVRESWDSLRQLVGPKVEMVPRLSPAAVWVSVDPTQLHQILIHLALNARDAMPRGGQLTIETALARLRGDESAGAFEVRPGAYVLLSVHDSGVGMSDDVLRHVFEPFFTTKEMGRGSGLGLSTVYGIVKQSQGYIWADSQRQRGSSFRIYLPAAESAVAEEGPPLPVRAVDEQAHETVLLVEDEDAVRSLVRQVLAAEGYRVLTAGDGDEALRMASDHGRGIDLLLTDLVMPGMTGRELALHLQPLHPETRILFMSGYSTAAYGESGELGERAQFLHKPFTPEALVRRVRELLAAPPAAASA